MLRRMEDDAPELIRTLAEGCVRFVKQAVGIELDGTPDTLPILDHYLTLARDDEEARKRNEVLGLVATSAGAYFGEVVRRAAPSARWHLSDADDPSSWRIELDHVFLSFNPVGMAREAITEKSEEGWNAHVEVLAQDRNLIAETLERVGGVSEEDYFRLAIRWEVIEQSIAVLEGAAHSRGEAAQRFPREVYERVFGERAPDVVS